MNAKFLTDRARLPAILFAACILTISTEADAQTGPAHAPLPPPETAPESRLTVSPSEFERWMARVQGAEQPTEPKAPRAQEPALATAPPAAPAPRLVSPPPPPALAPTPGAPPKAPPDRPKASAPAATATPSPAPRPAQDERPATAERPSAPPPEPQPRSVPQQPDGPQVTTLPPDARSAPLPAPPGEPLVAPEVVTILYDEAAMEVPDAAKADLDRAAAWMQQNAGARMQIVGYAKGKSAVMASEAKRTSLYRTLAVRKYLVESGVLSTRMNLCAMGARAKEPPEDKVQLFMETESAARQCEDFVK